MPGFLFLEVQHRLKAVFPVACRRAIITISKGRTQMPDASIPPVDAPGNIT